MNIDVSERAQVGHLLLDGRNFTRNSKLYSKL